MSILMQTIHICSRQVRKHNAKCIKEAVLAAYKKENIEIPKSRLSSGADTSTDSSNASSTDSNTDSSNDNRTDTSTE